MSFLSAMRNNPFAKLLIFYFSGILFAYAINKPDNILFSIVVLIVLLIVFIILNKYPNFNINWHSGLIASVILFIAGFINLNIHFQSSKLIQTTNGFKGLVILEICEQPVISDKTVKSIAKIQGWKSTGTSDMCQQKILLYIQKDSMASELTNGSRLLACISLDSISPPKNPGEFNYKKYQAVRGIHNQTYISSKNWKYADPKKRQTFRTISGDMKLSLLKIYQKIGLNKTHYSLLSAITLGYKNDLEVHTRQAFSRAGVMHVMALSGYNVAVIVTAISYILFFTERIKYGIIFKTFVIIIVVWLFVFVTGMSPSVTRASVMVTLVYIGKVTDRNIKVSNILFVSAFIILSFSPELISDISFQLSFAAVLGIITFYPTIYGMLNFKFMLIDKVWQLFAVSCAAQLSTLPITLFYFHQFPVYFWLVNIFVVPLVSVIICLSTILLLFSFINPLMLFIGNILAFLLKVLYESVDFIEVLPYSLVDNININSVQMILMISILILVGIFIINKRISLIYTSLITIVIIQLISLRQIFEWNTQRIFMVGSLKGVSIINCITGRESTVFTNPVINRSNANLNYSFSNFWITHGIAESSDIMDFNELSFDRYNRIGKNKLFIFNNKRILWLCDNEIYNCKIGIPMKVDYLIINKELKTDVFALKEIINARLIIIDSSVSVYKAGMWEKNLQKAKLKYWIVNKQGAFLCTV